MIMYKPFTQKKYVGFVLIMNDVVLTTDYLSLFQLKNKKFFKLQWFSLASIKLVDHNRNQTNVDFIILCNYPY